MGTTFRETSQREKDMIPLSEHIISLDFPKSNRIDDIQDNSKCGDFEVWDKFGRKAYEDHKLDFYRDGKNVIIEVCQYSNTSWTQTKDKDGKECRLWMNYLVYIRTNANKDYCNFVRLDYEYIIKVFVYTHLFRDRVMFLIGQKTYNKFFKSSEIPNESKYYKELDATINPTVSTGEIPYSSLDKSFCDLIKSYGSNPMSDEKKYGSYSDCNDPNDESEVKRMFGEHAVTKKVADEICNKMYIDWDKIFTNP